MDNIVYLNRSIDTVRKKLTEDQLNHYNLPYNRFEAITENLQDFVHEPLNTLGINVAQASCLVSHLEIIRNYGVSKPLLVFEDDIDLSTMDYWDFSLDDLFKELPKNVGIFQLFFFPVGYQGKARLWVSGLFGTAAYLIRPEYANKLVTTGYIDGKWKLSAFPNKYVQRVADSVLYSSTRTMSLSIFATRKEKSTILPHATYPDVGEKALEQWKTSTITFSSIVDSIDNCKKYLDK